MSDDQFDPRLALGATGRLAEFNRAGVLSAADVHVAARLGSLCGCGNADVELAAALAVRAVRLGSVCIDLATVQGTASASEATVDAALNWPETSTWTAACSTSPMVAVGSDGPADRPLRLVDGLLYLDRYWRQEQLVRRELDERAERPPPAVDGAALTTALGVLFPAAAPDHQRLAAAAAATGWLTIIAGGPGTGKTTTVARLLALLHAVSPTPPRVALAAPTGKAAARLQESVAHETARIVGLEVPPPAPASTLHRLLGWRPDSRGRFKHDRNNRLPYDVVLVDETSMVSLTLMSRLLEAVRSEARLVLVGDPDQLASVEAGAVLGDLVGRPPRAQEGERVQVLRGVVPADLTPEADVVPALRRDVVRLTRNWRFSGTINLLAEAVRTGDAHEALRLLESAADDLEFVQDGDAGTLREDVLAAGEPLLAASRAGDVSGALELLNRHRLLCAHRRGRFGAAWWARDAEAWLRAGLDGYGAEGEWYVGRPLIATANDYELKLYNGDTGVVVAATSGPVAVFGRGSQQVLLPPSRPSEVQTVHAMTVHRGQGSQFERVSLVLPPPESPLLTRELLYTAITRAETFVRVIGSAEAVRKAVEQPIVRASGLRRRPAEQA